MRFLNKKDGGQIHDDGFFTSMDMYHETNNFIFLADAFVTCQQKGYELPDELLNALSNRFQKLVDANSKADGLAALGFDSNKIGGAWMGKDARNKMNHAQVKSFMQDLEAFGVGENKQQRIDKVAELVGLKPETVRKICKNK